jgi:ABC-2 type transport system permease protein
MTFSRIVRASRKLVVVGRVSARHRLSQRAAAIGRIGMYGVLLFVFSRLWSVIGDAYPSAHVSAERLLWYIAITEWIVLSLPPLHDEVQEELRSGDLVYRLTRPLAYPWAKLAEGFGDLFVRMGVHAIAGVGFAFAFTGTMPLDARAIAWVVPLGVLAAMVATTFQLAIGLVSFWIHDCRPVQWVWQKGLFLLGGLLVPLELYPEWLRAIAVWSPFAAILHGCGSLALGDGEPVLVALRLVAWFAVALVVVALLFRRGLRRIDAGGG